MGARGKRGGLRLLLGSSSVATLLIGGGAPAAFAQCAVSPGTNHSSVSNSAAINCININGITVTGNVTNTGSGIITATGFTAPTRTGITINDASVGGAVVNAGSITASAFGNGIFVTNNATVSGGISNSGTISVAYGSGAGILVGGRITSGARVLIGTFAGGISNSGTISVVGAGISVGGAVSIGTFSEGIGNSGTIAGGNGILLGGFASASRTATVLISAFSGGISNSGTISAGRNGIMAGGSALSAGSSGNPATVMISTFSGGVSNSGTISAGSTGILVGGTAQGNFSYGDTATVTISTFSGGISNSGAISVSNSGSGAGIFVGGQAVLGYPVSIGTFSGGISNSGTISYVASSSTNILAGILVGGLGADLGTVSIGSFSGGISNSGMIAVAGSNAYGFSGVSGIVVGGFAEIDGIVTVSTFAGGISNSGTISAGRNGIFVGGTVQASTITISTFFGGIANSGIISAGGNGIFVGGVALSGGAITIAIATFSGGISNSGTILAGNTGVGIDVLYVSTFIDGITNSGTISVGGSGAGIVVGATSFYGNVSNSGTITGGHTGIFICGCATFEGGAIVNTGVISASANAINASGATSPITIDQNAGTITGNILLSANADVLNISGGTINGNVLGQGSANTVNFALGAGSFAYASPYAMTGLNLVNFNSGTAYIDGSIQATTIDINNGGTAAGTGTFTGPVTVMSGGTLMPGEPLGTLHIAGSLTFNAVGSDYGVHIAPGANNNSATAVTGAANLNGDGTVVVTPQIGHYTANDYVILTAAPRNGTFAGLVVNGDFAGSIALDYSVANEVLLDVSGSALFATPPGAGQNQQKVLNGINNAILAGETLPPGFQNLGNLSGPALLNAITQLDGQNATGAETSAFQLMTDFLNLLTDPSSGGGANPTGGGAPGFAPEQDAILPSDIAQAYASILKKAAPQQQSFDQRWTAWGAAFGGAGKLDGDPSVGSNSVTASDYGYAAGMDYHATPNSVYGFALSGGGTNWTVAQNLGSGRSDSFQVGVHDTTHWGPLYVSGALAFANHWFTTNRIAVGDQLQAKFDGQSYAVRGEAGYRYALPVTNAIIGVTPYAALQVQDFHTQGFSETDLTGGGLGLAFAAMNATDTRSELGARFDNLQVVDGMPLVLRARLAWAHDWVSNPSLGAVFQALPGSNFTVNGAAVPENSALTTAAAELHINANWTAVAKFDGEFAQTAQTYAGTGTLRYSW
jgi:uncharacterized protein with beta-barrel porin domain